MEDRPLRLMVYDRTCRGGRWLAPGLSHAWQAGAVLYRGLRRLDDAFGASSWDEALAWLGAVSAHRPIGEIQFWGHGKWGCVKIADDGLDRAALLPSHRLHRSLVAVRERLVSGAGALVWLRTCEAFGARRGLDFAAALADFTGARVAGHTYIIGAVQSGLHGLLPGHTPDWSPDEGILEGTPEAPRRARWSNRGAPRTITCFDGEVPAAWFA